MRLDNLAVLVLEKVGHRPVEDAGASGAQGRGVLARRDAPPRRLDANEADRRLVDEVVEEADRIAAAADTSHDDVGQAAKFIEALLPGFAAKPSFVF